MQRMGMVIGIDPQHIDEYKRLHAQVWPTVLDRLKRSNVTRYSIFLREPENLLFGYWEYVGTDYESDMAEIASDPETQRWWSLCSPCQKPLVSRAPSEHWARMEEVFYLE
ncbi:L-rhamnose mutarotase [Paraburkholderia sp. MM5496-R1]